MTQFVRVSGHQTAGKSRTRIPGRILQILIALFLYIPIFTMIAFSFNSTKSRTVWSGFTWKWYEQLFNDQAILNSFYITLVVAVSAAVAATIIGTAAAIGIHVMRKTPKKILLTLNNIPVVNPDIITGLSLMLLFGVFITALKALSIDVELGLGTLMLAHITFCIPYVILSVMPKLSHMGMHVYEAALDLGARPVSAFFKVIFPEILPGIASGLMIAFTMSIDDFMVSYFTAGVEVQTLPVYIYSMTRRGVSPEINALSTIMFLAVLVLLVVINLLQAIDNRKAKQSVARR